jgi:60 kDa SS-A/Ro ribonucleoprotein
MENPIPLLRSLPAIIGAIRQPPTSQHVERHMKYAKLIRAPVPQSAPLDPRQVMNNAGGYVFRIDDWARLDRFLILGSDAPTYYQHARDLTRENAGCIERCYLDDPDRTAARVADISETGRAPKNDAAIFALAVGSVHGNVAVRRAALAALPRVCRTASHLFQFTASAHALGRGWGRTLKRAVCDWYGRKTVDQLAWQMIKYRSREGYDHKRLLETSHAPGGAPDRTALYKWAKGKAHDGEAVPGLVKAHLAAMQTADPQALAGLVAAHGLPWEAVPTAATREPALWKAMLPTMGLTAMIRNLGAMTSYGALRPLEAEVETVVRRLTDPAELRKARIHPFNVVMAHAVYRAGKGVKGGLTWKPVGAIVDALDEAFYRSFQAVEPSGKRTMVCIDVSGSMSSPLMGSPLSVCEGAAALAMTTVRTEPNWHVMAFSDRLWPLPLSARMSLAEVTRHTRNINFGRTDCALPMLHALERGLSVDVFVVLTDNETWAGTVHPAAALREYRRKTGIPAKLIVAGMTSTGFSIADPDDGGMLDVVGFDAAAPAVMAGFAR